MRTSRHRRSTAVSTCNFIAFASVRSISFGNCTPNDLFVDDHARHHFPTRSGSIDRNQPNKNQTNPQGKSQFRDKSVSKVLTRSATRTGSLTTWNSVATTAIPMESRIRANPIPTPTARSTRANPPSTPAPPISTTATPSTASISARSSPDGAPTAPPRLTSMGTAQLTRSTSGPSSAPGVPAPETSASPS